MSNKLESNPTLTTKKKGRPLLDYAANPSKCFPRSADLVQILLENGANPNQGYQGRAVWENRMRWQAYYNYDSKIGGPPRSSRSIDIQNRAATIRLMLEYGADKRLRDSGPEGAYSVLSIAKIFMAEAQLRQRRLNLSLVINGLLEKESRERVLL